METGQKKTGWLGDTMILAISIAVWMLLQLPLAVLLARGFR
jgi:hypothetical protein